MSTLSHSTKHERICAARLRVCARCLPHVTEYARIVCHMPQSMRALSATRHRVCAHCLPHATEYARFVSFPRDFNSVKILRPVSLRNMTPSARRSLSPKHATRSAISSSLRKFIRTTLCADYKSLCPLPGICFRLAATHPP